MSHETKHEAVIRRYLLGRLTEDERRQFEEDMMTDNDLFDALLLAEDDMVEEYLEGSIPEPERTEFESAYLSTPDGHNRLNLGRALRTYVSNAGAAELRPATSGRQARWWARPDVAPYLRAAAAALIVLGLGFGTWREFFFQTEVAKGTAALARAYRAERPVEARISALGYAPFESTRGAGKPTVDQLSLNRAELILVDEAALNRNPASAHALALLYLSEHKFDNAIDLFEEALKGEPNNARFHGDLGAAYLERAGANSDKPGLGDLARSLEESNRAIELDESLLESRFNKALCLQRMNAPTSAREAWEQYLKKDANSEWSKEARKKLELLPSQGT